MTTPDHNAPEPTVASRWLPWKERFGVEYPAALMLDGTRLALKSERPWMRSFATADRKMTCVISRFLDGSAALTYPELAREWPGWDHAERADFCGACSYLHPQTDFPEMLRFIMAQGNPDYWSSIALSVGSYLPPAEAFALLAHALSSMAPGESCNISQGIARTGHPEAVRLLRDHLATLWTDSTLWEDDVFTNWIAYAATCTIQHLIQLGVPPTELADEVRLLAAHPCSGNRQSCLLFLGKHYEWLQVANAENPSCLDETGYFASALR